MSQRKIRTIQPSMTIGELRRLALGEELTKWSAEVEPELRKAADDQLTQLKSLIGENQRDILALELMEPVMDDEPEARKVEITRLTIQLERQTAVFDRLVNVYQRLSAGGAASIWAAMQRQSAPPPPTDAPERNVTPMRRLREATQVVDSE